MARTSLGKGRIISSYFAANTIYQSGWHYSPPTSFSLRAYSKDLPSLPIDVRINGLPVARAVREAFGVVFPSTAEETMAHHIQNKEDLEAKLTEAGDNLVVIDFSATWCGPCRMIGPVFESMASEMQFSNVLFLKVDVDECDDIAAEYEISAMPTFVFLRKSQKVSTFSGANADKLRQTIVSLL